MHYLLGLCVICQCMHEGWIYSTADLPEQVVPLPSKPGLQVQLKPPSMFLQVAWVPQSSIISSHSSISVVIKINHQHETMTSLHVKCTHLYMPNHSQYSHVCMCSYSSQLCFHRLTQHGSHSFASHIHQYLNN